MLKISVKQSRAVCSKRTMAPVALDAVAFEAPDREAQDREAQDKEADALASVGPDKVDPDKADALASVGPGLADVVRAIVEVQQESVAA